MAHARLDILALEVTGAKPERILVDTDQGVQRGRLPGPPKSLAIDASLGIGERPPVLLRQLPRSFAREYPSSLIP